MLWSIRTIIRTKIPPLNKPNMDPNKLFLKPPIFLAFIRTSIELKILTNLLNPGSMKQGPSLSILILRIFDRASVARIKAVKTITNATKFRKDSLTIVPSMALISEIIPR